MGSESRKERRQARILLAEDEEIMQTMIQMMIRNKGYEVELAADGEEAVNKWRGGGYDMIIMDLQMPVMDGIEATKAIRALEEGGARRVPIIALTAHAFPEVKLRCRSAGMDDYLTKPFEFSRFYSIIERYLAPPVMEDAR